MRTTAISEDQLRVPVGRLSIDSASEDGSLTAAGLLQTWSEPAAEPEREHAAARGLRQLDGTHHAPCCSFGPKRELCTASEDQTVSISDADTGRHLHTLPKVHTDGRMFARR